MVITEAEWWLNMGSLEYDLFHTCLICIIKKCEKKSREMWLCLHSEHASPSHRRMWGAAQPCTRKMCYCRNYKISLGMFSSSLSPSVTVYRAELLGTICTQQGGVLSCNRARQILAPAKQYSTLNTPPLFKQPNLISKPCKFQTTHQNKQTP